METLDSLSEIGDQEVEDLSDELEPSIYTADLTRWLGSHNYRPEYCDEAVADFGSEGSTTLERIALGQLRERTEVFWAVLEFLRGRLEEIALKD